MKLLVTCILCLASISVQASQLTYSAASDSETFTPYIKELIIEAHKTQYPKDTLFFKASKKKMIQDRSLEELRSEKNLDIFWTMTSKEREHGLYVLRIPLLKGMLGLRALVIRKGDSHRFSQIKTFKDAKKFVYIQGHDWPDTFILESAGLNIEKTAYYHGIMDILDSGRVDAYPLGINEIAEELENRPKLSLVADQNILFSYNAPVFIFMNADRKPLQRTMEKGFKAIIQNGTLDRLFSKYFKGIISDAHIEKRRIFKIKNPYMSDKTSKAMKDYSSMLIVK